MTRPACQGRNPEMWFPDVADLPSENTFAARMICESCPMRRDCGKAAIAAGDRWGIRAGFYLGDSDEVNDLRKFLGKPRVRHPRRTCEGCGLPVTGGACDDCLNDGVPAGPVRDHIERLRAMRVPFAGIAKQAGITLAELRSIRFANGPMMPRAIAERVCSVPVPDSPCGCADCGRQHHRLTMGLCPACYKRPAGIDPLVLVDAGPAREHIRRLQPSMKLREISYQAGVSRSVIDDLLYGKTRSAGVKAEVRRIRAVTSGAILAVAMPQGVSA